MILYTDIAVAQYIAKLWQDRDWKKIQKKNLKKG